MPYEEDHRGYCVVVKVPGEALPRFYGAIFYGSFSSANDAALDAGKYLPPKSIIHVCKIARTYEVRQTVEVVEL